VVLLALAGPEDVGGFAGAVGASFAGAEDVAEGAEFGEAGADVEDIGPEPGGDFVGGLGAMLPEDLEAELPGAVRVVGGGRGVGAVGVFGSGGEGVGGGRFAPGLGIGDWGLGGKAGDA
jgi:hypothetical protein